MKKQMRLILVSLALVTILLVAAVPVTARPVSTPFVTVVYPCSQLDPGHVWTDKDGVTHIRGGLDYAILESEDPRLTGTGVWRTNQDVLPDGTGPAWGTMVIETDLGIWRIVWKADYDQGIPTSHGQGHGSHGLEGLAMTYEGRLIAPPSDTCNAPVAVEFSGDIIDHNGD
jgi:hypothetical protein